MPNQVYRFRVRTADDLADTLVLTSIRSGTNPYIVAPPSGDGQEVDLLTGGVRTGAYVVEVADAVTGSTTVGTLRVVTSKLNDGVSEFLLLENGDKLLLESGDPIEMEQNNADFGRPHLLSRKAFVEMSTDNGATWTVWIAGFLSSIRQVDAIRYAFTVSNTRRIEQTKQVFTWQTAAERTAFPKRGCIFGGPIIGGLGGGTVRTIDSGGWEFLYQNTTGTSTPVTGDTLALKYDYGYYPPLYERKQSPGPNQAAQFWASLQPFLKAIPGNADAAGSAFADLRAEQIYAAPDLLCLVTDPATGNVWEGELRAANLGVQPDNNNREQFINRRNLYVQLTAPTTSWPTLPATNTRLRVRAVTRTVSEASPLYLQAHPVAIAEQLYTLANLPVDSTSVTTVTNALGPTMLVTLRITAATNMAEFLETTLYGPFGFAPRYNANGEVEFFTTRALSATAPTLTIADADLVGDTPPAIYDVDESTVVTGFTITQTALQVATNADTAFVNRPSDGVFATPQALPYVSGDTTTYSTRVVEYTIPGMMTDAQSFVPTFAAFAQSIAREGFDRFGRGAVMSEVHVLRSAAAAAAQIGDFVYLNAGYYPNKNYRIGESTVGPRVAQVVRREERPEGPIFKLVDAGVYVQPAIAPTISIVASSSNPRRVANFTITNAATLINAADLSVAIEYAVSATTPAGGITFARYTSLQIPLGAVELPAVKPGSRVWVRARSEQAGVFPSLWTAWTDVTLTTWVAPTSVTIGTKTNATLAVSWSLNGNTSDPVDVYVAPGAVAPSDWTPYRINTLPPGTTTTTVTGLTTSTTYIVGIAFRDMVANVAQNPVTATDTTAGTTTGTATRPAGVQVVAGVDDANLPQGTVLGLWSAAGAITTLVERATSSGGTFSEIAELPADATIYVDYLPRNGTTYYYRLKHRTPGQADSSATAEVSAAATGVSSPLRPDALAPVVIITTSETSTTGTVTIGITDPQNRLQQVRFRERTNNGAWSAWTVDSTAPYSYTVTLPTTGFVEVEYEVTGFGADGVSRVLAGGVESFDVGNVANIVSASGTFSLAGALTLGLQADTDTLSFKYAVATTDWASDALAYSAAQAGTLVNARNATVILAGPYAVGTTVYLAIAAYTGASASGVVSGPYRYSFLNGARDTVSLVTRARVKDVDADNVTVRVAVADPYPQGTNSATIGYSALGVTGVTPVTGQTVTPDSTLTENANTYKDFTVPRPAAGSPPGRITFTVTAASREAATDAVDVMAKNPSPASLTVNYTTTDATYEITWSVGATDTATVSIDGGAYSTPATSPITVARAPYEGGSDKIYTFKSTGVQGDVVTSSVNVARQLPYVTNPPTLNITSIVKDSSTSFTTTWTYANMPSGTTFSLTWRVFDVGSGSGTTTGITLGTSPRSYQITTATGLATGSIVRVTVTAKDSGGNAIASDTDSVTF